jgi:hypothetical protein
MDFSATALQQKAITLEIMVIMGIILILVQLEAKFMVGFLVREKRGLMDSLHGFLARHMGKIQPVGILKHRELTSSGAKFTQLSK